LGVGDSCTVAGSPMDSGFYLSFVTDAAY